MGVYILCEIMLGCGHMFGKWITTVCTGIYGSRVSDRWLSRLLCEFHLHFYKHLLKGVLCVFVCYCHLEKLEQKGVSSVNEMHFFSRSLGFKVFRSYLRENLSFTWKTKQNRWLFFSIKSLCVHTTQHLIFIISGESYYIYRHQKHLLLLFLYFIMHRYNMMRKNTSFT